MSGAMGALQADALPAGEVRPRQRSLPTAGPPRCIGNDGDDAMGRHHGRRGSRAMVHVIAQVVVEQLGVPSRAVRPRPSASWPSVRRTGGPSPAMVEVLKAMPRR